MAEMAWIVSTDCNYCSGCTSYNCYNYCNTLKSAFVVLLYRMVNIDIKIKTAIIVVMTVIFVMAVYCIYCNGCNINVYCFIGYNDYNCLNGL